ncbi:MAG: MlaD family protein [Bdellovibrionia bacterium]
MTNHATAATKYKVGIFTAIGFFLIFFITIVVNNRPYWWKSCQLVKINVEDATGIKTKSPIRSLGIEIGYLSTVELTESHVTLGICLTAPVEVLPDTRAYIRGEGFLGDKFVELKPIKYIGNSHEPSEENHPSSKSMQQSFRPQSKKHWLAHLSSWILPSAHAAVETPQTRSLASLSASPSVPKRAPAQEGKDSREIPLGQQSEDVQHLVERVDDLVQEMSGMTSNLKKSIDPNEMKRTLDQLNATLLSANRTLSPEGGLNQTAQRALVKLEDAIEQLRDLMTRVNKGEGSVGMLLNDPAYAEEIRQAMKNLNRLLNRVAEVRFIVDLGGALMPATAGGRAYFNLAIWPRKDRYYLLGVASDPRGRILNTVTTTRAGGLTQTVETQVQDQTAILVTAMIGKVFWNRLDLSVGALYGDGAASLKLNLGPEGSEEMVQIRNDVYLRTNSAGIDDRLYLSFRPHPHVYLLGGVESFKNSSGAFQPSFLYGAGMSFDDDDIKLLFSLR